MGHFRFERPAAGREEFDKFRKWAYTDGVKIKIHRPGEQVTAYPMAEVTWSGDFPPHGNNVTIKGFPGQMDYVNIGNWYQLSIDGWEKIATAKAICTATKGAHMEHKVTFDIPEGWEITNRFSD